MTNDDMELVWQYARHQSEAAFATLVARHTDMVYSTALRQVRHPQLAEEITQVVFVILARKAASLDPKTLLSGWLYRTTCFTAGSALKQELRRQAREQEAYMDSTLHETGPAWEQMAPLLDEAMLRLGQADRDALVLRFFEGHSLQEVGAAMGASEDAAKKRVTRAVEKLRQFFGKRGVVISAAALTVALSTHSVQAAPATLAKIATSVAITKGTASSGSTLTLIKGALKIMAWTKVKMTVVVGVSVLLAAGTTTVVVRKITHPTLSTTDLSWANDPKYWVLDFNNPTITSDRIRELPPVLILRPTRFPRDSGMIGIDGRVVAKNQPVLEIFRIAYDPIYEYRTVGADQLPKEHFDLMLTLPDEPQRREKLQAELKQRFGFTAHYETNETDVYQLKQTRTDAPGLIPTKGGKPEFAMPRPNRKDMAIKNMGMFGLARSLETYLKKPVFDQTGLKGNYDCDIVPEPRPDESRADAFKRAVYEQLGLSFVPDRAPIKYLVIEPAKE